MKKFPMLELALALTVGGDARTIGIGYQKTYKRDINNEFPQKKIIEKKKKTTDRIILIPKKDLHENNRKNLRGNTVLQRNISNYKKNMRELKKKYLFVEKDIQKKGGG